MSESKNWGHPDMSEQDWTPTCDIDVNTPNIARIYDWLLGGKDHFEADREAAAQMLVSLPEVPMIARANRAFLQRAVRYLADEAGIRQFVDIGTGLPTQGNVHEIAQQVAPDARVVYIDYDPVVLAHGGALLATNAQITVIQGDLRRPEEILVHPELHRLIDLNEPVAVLLVAILHFVSDKENPGGCIAALRDVMAPGSYLVISHGAPISSQVAAAAAVYERATSKMTLRTREEVTRLFAGFELLDPGLVSIADWRPVGSVPGVIQLQQPGNAAPASTSLAAVVGGVGRKP